MCQLFGLRIKKSFLQEAQDLVITEKCISQISELFGK